MNESPFRTIAGARFAHRSVGRMDNNAYVIATGREALLIDAAADADALDALVDEAGARLTTIVTTHRHHDHIGALAELAERTGARLLAGRPDVDAIAQTTGVRPDGVWDGDSVRVGDVDLAVIGLVGHTPGSITLAWSPEGAPVQLFTGDSLFPGGVGKTGSPADFASLLGDVEAKLFDRYGDDAIVWPGHGEPTTLGAERPHLGEWRRRGW